VNFLLDNWIWILTALASGGLLLLPALQAGASKGISPQEAVQVMNREKGVVIDVSEPAEFAAGHVMGARNVPLGTLDAAKELPSNKTLPLILMCATGARASRAVAKLTERGHARVHVLRGGMAAWRSADLPVEKSA
jgi:rhodanese-related sulfurtransferase